MRFYPDRNATINVITRTGSHRSAHVFVSTSIRTSTYGAPFMDKKTILAADTRQGTQTIHNILGDSVFLVDAHSLLDALNRISGADLILCGIHFDDSRMFDLLTQVRSRPALKSTPFIVYRDLESALDATLFKSMEVATNALGADGFVDLFLLKKKYGVREADAQFREFIFEHIGLSPSS
jgi:PleD family two-component response regulator